MRILETLSWNEIAAAIGASVEGTPVRAARGASIDTRTIEPGDIFVALKGERVNGHDHVEAAFVKGASCAVIKKGHLPPEGTFALVVRDPEAALFELGRLVRARSGALFVAITGSAGKTTAKEFTAEVLKANGPVLATRGNLNNHLGVPLTLARLETDHWAAVIECGMSHSGELSRLADLVRPKIAAITNVAPVHLEFFDSVAGIAAAKAEIFETLGTNDTAVAPADEPLLWSRALATKARVRLFGEGARSSVKASDISMTLDGSRFQVEAGGERCAVTLPAPGPHAIANFLLATAVATAAGLSLATCAERASNLRPGSNRGSVRHLQGDILLIDDTYNSNPKALQKAVETLALAKDRRRVACIGDMLELGPDGARLHREAGAAIGSQIDLLIGVGTLAEQLVLGASNLPAEAKCLFENSTALASRVAELVHDRDAVLVKGSRGMRMERVVEALVAAHPVAAHPEAAL
ncbi:MAG: UDP-N-acetylmuramoyl-tripeptide--D-alanyl-D-alanine ligase [Vicinamibacteria bacterium]